MLALTLGAGPLQLLVLGAHSDDIEIGCGGTLLSLITGSPHLSVTWVVFSGAEEREREARASASAFLEGAARVDVRTLSFRESYFPAERARIKDAFESLKSVEPDVIFSHHESDRHQDHRLVSELTWNTFRSHLILEYEIPKYDGDLGNPSVFVPLSRETCERKCELLERHFVSQRSRSWFDDDVFMGLMRIRGLESGASSRYAEAFHARKLVLG